MSPRRLFFIVSVVVLPVSLGLALLWSWAFVLLGLALLLFGLGLYDLAQREHTITRVYPVIGHLRYLFEAFRPEIQQYFVESNTNGAPFSREHRDLVYQRAKGDLATRPFGTQFDVYADGYEWIDHSLGPKSAREEHPRVSFGNSACSQPYAGSLLNISAMSFGALSRNAVLALNQGARLGGFAHNTGEGGLSPYHLEPGGDLIWQIGTGYFGCRDARGRFDPVLFAENSQRDAVKMIEIKLSQGAKPGHGGILPAAKVTSEIAQIRGVPLGQDVISPPMHSAFDSPLGLVEFIADLREKSGGKPVGFKLCIGRREEFLSICRAMLESGITADFVTVDGAEGGTGAAPIEFTNAVGTPLREGLEFVRNALIGTALRDRVRIIAAGKAISAFHVACLLALGADTVNTARAMMFALGCIQSRSCNNDRCPTGITTQNPARYRALDVDLKARRVANYHAAMIKSLGELIGAAGLDAISELEPGHINRRLDCATVKTYAELYPVIDSGCLLDTTSVPTGWKECWERADTRRWKF